MAIRSLIPQDLKTLLDQDQVVLVDVREPDEYRQERIAQAINIPLGSIDAQGLKAVAGKTIVFQCQGGRRSQEACCKLGAVPADVASLEGGIEGWKKAGFATGGSASTSSTLPLMRQVQLIIGASVLIGTALGYAIHPVFLVIPAFMGAGLANAGLTGWCGLARLLALMPWNRIA